jgi:hypothetical protein
VTPSTRALTVPGRPCRVCATARLLLHAGRREENLMFSLNDLFQWERFITPSIIQWFYWLVLCITALLGISGIASAVAVIKISFVQGLMLLAVSVLGIMAGVLFARIAAEFVLMIFRINEHLGAIRNRGEM